jgi:predicted ATPase/DNA-binding winged helix-turn-helix (wHTH) protein
MTQSPVYSFGPFRLLPEQRELWAGGEAVKIGGRAFDLLHALVDGHARTMTRSELFDRVWPGRVVEDQNLHVQVVQLRKLLGPKAITTVPGRGYRFALPVQHDGGAAATPAAPAARPTGSAAPPVRDAHRHNLPTSMPVLHGRSADLAALMRLLETQRLVTLTGPGGIGKTRLAQAAAAQWLQRSPDGVWQVELTAVSDAAALPAAIAQALGFAAAGPTGERAGLAQALAPLSLLVLLDNAEHLVDDVASLAELLLAAAPQLRLLVTSQAPLRLRPEQVHRLGPLPVPSLADATLDHADDSVSLFAARAAERGVALRAEQLATVVEICRQLDGLPLAIELAAARVPLLGVQGVHDRLDQRLRLLTGGARDADARHRTLADAIAWSHELLSDDERRVFRRLGVFVGGFGLASAQQVAADASLDEWSVLDHLGALVDKSLVIADSAEPPRYHLLESARAFALEQLHAHDDPCLLRARHAEAMLTLAGQAHDRYFELTLIDYQATLAADLDNLRAAIAWALEQQDAQKVAAFIGQAFAAFGLAGAGREAAQLYARARPLLQAAGDSLPPLLRAHAALEAAYLGYYFVIPAAEGVEAARLADRLYEQVGDRRWRYVAMYVLALLAERSDDRRSIARAVTTMRELEQPDWAASVRYRRRFVEADQHLRDGDLVAWRDAFRVEMLALQANGEWRGAWHAAHNVVQAELALSRPAEALAVITETVGQIRATGRERQIVYTVALLACTLIECGERQAARDELRTAVALLRAERTLWWAGDHAALFALQAGLVDDAARLAAWCDAAGDATGQGRRTPAQSRVRAQLTDTLAASLPAERLAALSAEGRAWGEADALRVLQALTA